MAICFQLIGEDGNAKKFSDIDNEICAMFEVIPDETYFYMNWYDWFGLLIASGKTMDEIKVIIEKNLKERIKTAYLKILEYLSANYEWRSFIG